VKISSTAGRNPAITYYGKYPMIHKALYIPGAGYPSINSMNHQLKRSNLFSYLRKKDQTLGPVMATMEKICCN